MKYDSNGNLLVSGVSGGVSGSGDASAANQTAGNTILTNILTQLQGDRAIASQLFTDAANTTYLKVLAYNQTTNTYESATIGLNGSSYVPTPPETAMLQSDLDTVEAIWEITASGAGYTVGDTVSQYSLIKPGTPPVVSAVLWYNQNTSAPITSPILAHRRLVGSASATEATLSTRLSEGTPIAGETIPSGNGALGWLSSLRQKLDTVLTKLPASLGAKVSAGSYPVVLASDQVPNTLAQNWKTQLTDGTNVTPVGDSTQRSILTSIGNSIRVDLTGAAYSFDTGQNVLTASVNPTGMVSPLGIQYADILARLVGNSAITGGTLRFFASSSSSGPFNIPLDYTLDGGNTISNQAFTVTSGQVLDVYVMNPAHFPYITCEVVTPFTGATTGVRPDYYYSLQAGMPSPLSTKRATNLNQINGVAVSVGSGSTGPGTQRVVQAQITTNFQGAVQPTVSDFSIAGRLRKLKLLNESGVALYIGIYNSAVALTPASVPQNGLVWRVPSNADFFAGVADFGECGTFYSANTRIGISSTRSTYTALTAPQRAAIAFHLEAV